MTAIRNALIVGGGIGGLSAAIALRDRGVAVDIVEIKSEWTVYGVGIIQQSNVVRAAHQLGILERYLKAGFPFDDVAIYGQQGQVLARMPGHRLAGPEYPPNLGISRLALHEVLSKTAIEKGAQVRLGTTVTAITQTADAATVTFTDGSSGIYDLVVGADGLYSRVRSLVFGDELKPRFTGQSVWRHNFKRRPEVDHLVNYPSPKGNAGLVPLADDLMYMFVTTTEPGNPRMPEDRLAELMRDRLEGYGGLIAECRKEITRNEDVVYKPMEVIMLPEPWYRGRVILIGDAAHATTPHLGQGAGMAMEDAVVLADEVAKCGSVREALEHFMERRYDRCKFIVENSILVGEWEMTNSPDTDHAGMVRRMLARTAQPI